MKKIVQKLKFGLCIIFSILFTNCKTDKKPDQYKSDLKLTDNLGDFTSKMTEQDTIKIIAELNMEWWIRHDELIITKKNNDVQLQATIKEDSTFEMKYEWRINKLPPVILKNSNNEFENHFVQKIERTKGRTDRGRIYKLMSSNDTLIFYTNGLGDKGGEVREYYEFMNRFYPKSKEFRFPGVEIEETDNITF